MVTLSGFGEVKCLKLSTLSREEGNRVLRLTNARTPSWQEQFSVVLYARVLIKDS